MLLLYAQQQCMHTYTGSVFNSQFPHNEQSANTNRCVASTIIFSFVDAVISALALFLHSVLMDGAIGPYKGDGDILRHM